MAETTDGPPIRDAMEKWNYIKPRPDGVDLPAEAGFETICAHQAEDPQQYFGAASPPIYQTSTFIYPNAESFERRCTAESGRHDYSRCSNPTTGILEAKLARLEKAEWADCFGSGMAAISAAINSRLEAGAHVVSIAHCYGPTQWYFNHMRRFSVETTFVNSNDPADFIAAIRPNTKIIYLESPTSGRFDVPELSRSPKPRAPVGS